MRFFLPEHQRGDDDVGPCFGRDFESGVVRDSAFIPQHEEVGGGTKAAELYSSLLLSSSGDVLSAAKRCSGTVKRLWRETHRREIDCGN